MMTTVLELEMEANSKSPEFPTNIRVIAYIPYIVIPLNMEGYAMIHSFFDSSINHLPTSHGHIINDRSSSSPIVENTL